MRRFVRNHLPEVLAVALIIGVIGGIAVRQLLAERSAVLNASGGGEDMRFEQLEAGMLLDVAHVGLAKVLVVDTGGVHLRFYAPGTTKQVAAKDRDLEFGHMPLSAQAWRGVSAIRIGSEPVAKAELDGYDIWKESSGLYFEDIEEASAFSQEALDEVTKELQESGELP